MARILDDWLVSYLEYTKHSESPTSYHTWIGLTVLAAALGRNYMNVTTNTGIYNNLFVLLIAPQGATRKSSAIDSGVKLLRDVDRVTISMDTGSEQGMLREFNECFKDEESNYLVRARELHSLILTSGIDLLHTLMTIYDQVDDYKKSLAQNSFIVKKPYLNFIAATTPSYLSFAFKDDIRQTGLMSRLLFIYEEEPRFSQAIYRKGDDTLREKLVHDLQEIAAMPSQDIAFEPSAFKNIYLPFYNSRLERKRQAVYTMQEAFVDRADNHILKTSALFALSRNRNVIQQADILSAKELLDKVFLDLAKVDQQLGQDRLASVKHRFEFWLAEKKVTTIQQVSLRFRRETSLRDIFEIVRQYELARMIRVKKKYPSGDYCPGDTVEWLLA